MKINLVAEDPRDGLQSLAGILPAEIKVALMRRLVDAGVRCLEVTSCVNPSKVPQLADAEAVMSCIDGVSYIGLVLNRKGFDRALAAGCHEVGMALVASAACSIDAIKG